MKKQTIIKICVLVAIAAAILALDLLTKYLLDAHLKYGESYSIIPHLFNFEIVYNIGAAWGLLAGKQVFLIVLTFVFIAIFTYYYVNEKNKTWLLTVAFAFLYGGCIGNLYDRIFLGYVRDFIQFDFWKNFPIFNFADIFLCFGCILFVIYLIMYFVKVKRNTEPQNNIKNNIKENIEEKTEENMEDNINTENNIKLKKNIKPKNNIKTEKDNSEKDEEDV